MHQADVQASVKKAAYCMDVQKDCLGAGVHYIDSSHGICHLSPMSHARFCAITAMPAPGTAVSLLFTNAGIVKFPCLNYPALHHLKWMLDNDDLDGEWISAI